MITIENSIRSFYVILLFAVSISCYFLNGIVEDQAQIETEQNYESTAPTAIEMYQLLEKYAEQYNIPKHIVYNIAYLESRYKGPFDWSYEPSLESFAGAVGPMQVMVSTAQFINHKSITKNRLKNDIETNIKTSMKLLRRLHDMYGNWTLVCGAYNTGRPIVNDYAIFCVSNKDYRRNWIYYQKK